MYNLKKKKKEENKKFQIIFCLNRVKQYSNNKS